MGNKILLIIIIYLRKNITLTKPELEKIISVFFFVAKDFWRATISKTVVSCKIRIEHWQVLPYRWETLSISAHLIWKHQTFMFGVCLRKLYIFRTKPLSGTGQMREKIEQKKLKLSLYQQASMFEWLTIKVKLFYLTLTSKFLV